MLWEKSLSDGTLGTVAPATFYDWREQSHTFEKMAAIDPNPDFILNGSGHARRFEGASVSQDFLSLLGTHMAVGRDFLPEEDHPGINHVVIFSYSTWQNHFGSRPDVIGTPVTLNNIAYTIVGVLPRDFSLVSKAQTTKRETISMYGPHWRFTPLRRLGSVERIPYACSPGSSPELRWSKPKRI
jgi:MacB-like periplasmic core domain